ncbi:MAG TPA: hypothetical protein VMG40_14965 [Bryobacteraceae bacterium]|nr:hypothetical protein [Bryobacteraceae bacterium]
MATKRGKKRPTDVNRLAHMLGKQSTENIAFPGQGPVSDDEVSRVMAALGRRGGKIGGKVRAERLDPEQRRKIARDAAKKRWSAAKNAK